MLSLARGLNAQGIATARGKAWSATALRGVLANPRIAGLRTTTERVEHDDGGITRGKRSEVGGAVWAPIIPVAQFRRVQALLATTSRVRGRAPRLLTGLVLCDKCGALMVANRASKSQGAHPIYVCNRQTGDTRGCRRNSIRADLLEQHVVPAMLRWAATWRAPEATVDVSKAEHELAAVAAERRRMGELLAQGMPTDTWKGMEAGLADRERVAQATIAKAVTGMRSPRSALLDGDLAERWPVWERDGDTAAMRAALAEFVQEVRVYGFIPGKGYDRRRVRVRYVGEQELAEVG